MKFLGSNEEFNEFFDESYKNIFGTISDHSVTAIYNTLVRNRLNDIHKLAAVTDSDLKDMKRVGPMAFNMIKKLREEALKRINSREYSYNEKWDNLDHILTVTICGSMEQKGLFPFAERLLVERFRNKGVIVHMPVLAFESNYPRSLVAHSIKEHIHDEKILSSDFILIVDGLFKDTAHVGIHTNREILFAREHYIPVFYLSSFIDVNFDRE